MPRSKRLLLLSHCLLNANAKVEGIEPYEGAFKPLILPLIEAGFGLIQLPCPELRHGGMRRWGQVKTQYDTPFYRAHCKTLLEPFVLEILEYQRCGYEVCGCIGVDGSPSCGVHRTCKGDWGGEIDEAFCLETRLESLHDANEAGVMIEVLQALLAEHGITLPFWAINEKSPHQEVATLLKELS
ncbi:MAG: hypothetical protein IBX45_07770 [Campylobacterales bacterium]|nr:hypothetical protein [Campylobacterales bacterium]